MGGGLELSAVRLVRRRAGILPWIRAAVFFAASMAAFSALPFYPSGVRPLLALVCAALGLFAPAIGVLVLVLALAIALAAGNFLVGALFLLVGLVSVQYFGQDGARVFVVVALAFVASMLKAEWALAPMAGYMLGAGEGAVAATVAVALLEAAGLVLGHGSTGILATGGVKPLVDAAGLASLRDPLSFGWLAGAVGRMDVDAVLKTLSSARNLPLLVVQPVLWGAAATLAGSLAKRDSPVRSLAAVVGATVLLAGASIGVMRALGGPVDGVALASAVPVSIVASGVFAALAAWVFPLVHAPEDTALPSLTTEDAEVDQLLRMIADAEEALEERHSAERVVLITDMKAFARMTQEQGTVATAKAIQKHRDLLLPVIAQHAGHGKSTGGDGLVAAFASADEALKAAVMMQRELKRYNEKRTEDLRIFVRMGIASGEVIVDRVGCPFIGDALNRAARVMGLADGGQVFAAADVVDSAAELPSPVVSHGGFSLKNITRPIDVYEVLWDEGQQPKRPESEPSAA